MSPTKSEWASMPNLYAQVLSIIDGDNALYDHERDTLRKVAQILAAEKAAERTQEPVGEWVQSKVGNYPHLKWAYGYVAKPGQKLYIAPLPTPSGDAA